MKRERYITGTLILLLALLMACGEDKDEHKIDVNALLPANLPTIGLERTSEIRIFDDKGLWEYINGGAELYLMYNFVEVATADYKHNDIEIVVDLYRFASEDDAFGLYSMFRTPDVRIIRLGVEGFTAPASLNYAKGKFLVRLVGYDESAAGSLALVNLAEEIGKLLPGTTDIPAMFGFFPSENQIPSTEKYYIESCLGPKSLQQVVYPGYFYGGD